MVEECEVVLRGVGDVGVVRAEGDDWYGETGRMMTRLYRRLGIPHETAHRGQGVRVSSIYPQCCTYDLRDPFSLLIIPFGNAPFAPVSLCPVRRVETWRKSEWRDPVIGHPGRLVTRQSTRVTSVWTVSGD